MQHFVYYLFADDYFHLIGSIVCDKNYSVNLNNADRKTLKLPFAIYNTKIGCIDRFFATIWIRLLHCTLLHQQL